MQDLGQFGQVSATAGGIVAGPRSIGMKRPHPSVLRARKAAVSRLGTTKNAADRIRALTDPARAKVVMDSTIKFVREENAAKAKQISAYIMQRASKKPGMGYLSYSWWNPLHVARGTPISDLEKYTEANRQLIFRYLRNSDPAVIEYSFTQANLDGALANAKAGERLPATTPVLKDPVKVAVDTFKEGVKQDIVNAPANVVAAATKVADIVGDGMEKAYEASKVWLKYLKWGAIIGGGLVAVAIVLPYVKAARAPAKLLA
jgi:hypothetical protein